MLTVLPLEEARSLILDTFTPDQTLSDELVALAEARGRRCAQDIISQEGVPAFDRSTVDGFAVHAHNTFGCSEAIPALLDLGPEVHMGQYPDFPCKIDQCNRISTGGMLPEGADAVVMLEFVEDYGDGTIGVMKPVSPGENIAFRYDDCAPNEILIERGTELRSHHIGTLASLGIAHVAMYRQPVVSIISSGDEIIPYDQEPEQAQMRDVNAPLLASLVETCGARTRYLGIVGDDLDQLEQLVRSALDTSDMVLVSGGTSASAHDGTPTVLSRVGELLFHGIAVKPGKPTLCAQAGTTPLFGLPGHPAAAYYVFCELVAPLLRRMSGAENGQAENAAGAFSGGCFEAVLTEAIPSNHGRTEFVPVQLAADQKVSAQAAVQPIHSKSGLISQLLGCIGYITVPRESEGLHRGATVTVKALL